MEGSNVNTYRITLSGPQVPGYHDKPAETFCIRADKVEHNRLNCRYSFFLDGKVQAILSITKVDEMVPVFR